MKNLNGPIGSQTPEPPTCSAVSQTTAPPSAPNKYMSTLYMTCSGPGSVVNIATGYGLDGPGIESRRGRDFPHLSTQPSVQWVPDLSRG